jgi:hypothetical protein
MLFFIAISASRACDFCSIAMQFPAAAFGDSGSLSV